MTTPDDRRRDERTAPDGPTPSSPAAPLVVDLSVGGCSVLLERDKELGEEVTVGIRLSDEDLDALELLAAPRWADDTYSDTHKQVGLQFTLLRAADIEPLEKLLARFQQAGDQPIHCQVVAAD